MNSSKKWGKTIQFQRTYQQQLQKKTLRLGDIGFDTADLHQISNKQLLPQGNPSKEEISHERLVVF